ncbi:hypothetical protein SEA_LUCKYSOCKE_117 [Streptomyces phage LuckySocke]|nr:hypothetical protein SEA_ALONE_121 [Streptomyces phage Alone3]WPH58951.1 hypothetical protein SEA_LUCKYSOCKE_117 [Streptomyces phage LuckySocke]
MAVRHEVNDVYELQVFVNGRWVKDRKVRKAGGANTARASANKTGKPYRVWNVTKNAVYVEVR